jgi:hypothetical protein
VRARSLTLSRKPVRTTCSGPRANSPPARAPMCR